MVALTLSVFFIIVCWIHERYRWRHYIASPPETSPYQAVAIQRDEERITVIIIDEHGEIIPQLIYGKHLVEQVTYDRTLQDKKIIHNYKHYIL